jgi:hypothetical protein
MSWVMDRLGERHSAADVEDRDTAEMVATKLTGEDLEQVQRGSLSFLFIRAKRALEWVAWPAGAPSSVTSPEAGTRRG